jgi:hypothetical protein
MCECVCAQKKEREGEKERERVCVCVVWSFEPNIIYQGQRLAYTWENLLLVEAVAWIQKKFYKIRKKIVLKKIELYFSSEIIVAFEIRIAVNCVNGMTSFVEI